MAKPTTSKGTYLVGLENRRKSEWTLFQTGYYDRINQQYQEGTEGGAAGGGSIISIADNMHKYMEANNYGYCVKTNGGLDECRKRGEAHGLNITFAASKNGSHHTCCATYVSWVLKEAGYLTDSEHTDSASALNSKLMSKGWQVITKSNQLQAGDIIYYSGHIEIYAGNGKVYGTGSGERIRGASPYNKNTSSMIRAFRAPNKSN